MRANVTPKKVSIAYSINAMSEMKSTEIGKNWNSKDIRLKDIII